MTLNPITALSEQLQKLINERGSAAILRDHLALFKDQVSLLEKKNVELTTENAELTVKIQVLQSENDRLTKGNKELRSKIQEYEQPSEQPMHTRLLDETKVKILKLLFATEILTDEMIAEAISVVTQTARYNLEELKLADMVKCTQQRFPPRSSHFAYVWAITQSGRAYLVENGEV